MARSRAKKKKTRPSKKEERRPAEDPRGAEAMTVFWMLTLVATLVAEVAMAVVILLGRLRQGEVGGPSLLDVLPGVMLFTALLTGSLCLVLTIVAHRVRRQPPPRSVTWTAVVVGVSPWAALLVLRAMGAN